MKYYTRSSEAGIQLLSISIQVSADVTGEVIVLAVEVVWSPRILDEGHRVRSDTELMGGNSSSKGTEALLLSFSLTTTLILTVIEHHNR